MPIPHGKRTGFKITDPGTLRDISSFVISVDFPRTADTAEVTTFNSTNDTKAYIVGLQDATISIEGKHGTTVDGYLNGLLASSSDPTFYVQIGTNSTGGPGNGFVQYTGSCILTSYSGPVASVDDAVTFSADFQVTGTVTRTTTT